MRFDDRGAGLIEYGFLVVLIAIVAIIAIQVVGNDVSAMYVDIASHL